MPVRTIRARSLALVLCATFGVLAVQASMVAPASAVTSVSLTKDVTVGAPPSSSFVGASSGDGWDVLFFGDSIFNVFHHGSQFVVDCHLQADGSHCDTVGGISPWPKTVSSTEPLSDFTSPAHSSGWIDNSTGKMYGWTSRISDGTGGMVCVDLTTAATNPFCGFTALTAAGDNPETDSTAIGGRAVVGVKLIAYDATIKKVLCFSTATEAACAGQPFDLPVGSIDALPGGISDTNTVAAGGKVFIHVEDTAGTGGVITCFNPATNAECAGAWPQAVSDAYPGVRSQVGAPFPYLSTTGTATGVCLPYEGVYPCWNSSGASIATPAAMLSALGRTDLWNDGAVLGTRVFVPTGSATGTDSDAVYCYDFATGAGCPNFPIETGNFSYLYTVTPDPVRNGCMWINADNSGGGGSQIRTFDGFDGSSGCSDRVHVGSSVVIPDAGCEALGWTNVQVLDPARSAYTSATLSLTDAQGAPIAGGTDLVIDAQGNVDLSALVIPDTVLYTATFISPTFSATGVIFRFTWDSTNTNTCTINASTVPDAPTLDTVAPDSAHGGLTVGFTPPADPGSSPIISYVYTTDNGATWRNRSDGATDTSPLEITQTSTDGTSLVDGVTYNVIVRAVNAAGTGLASNAIAHTAVVPELLAAPSSAGLTLGNADPVSLVYLAGYTADVTIEATTSNGTIAVVGNAGLTESPCTTCSSGAITFSGPQDAVNVALATLTDTAATVGGGRVRVTVIKAGDVLPTQSATVNLVVVLGHLTRPSAPTVSGASQSTLNVVFNPTVNAASYTVRVYRSNGITPVGAPHANFTSGTDVTGLDPSTTYRFTVTAIANGTTNLDSSEGFPTSAATLAPVPPVPQTPPPPPGPCATPRPSQLLPNGARTVYAVRPDRTLTTVPAFNGAAASLERPIIAAVATSSGRGSWSLAADGGVFTAGDAPFAGSIAGSTLKAAVVGIAGTPCRTGYDVVAADGGVFTFGRAQFYGSMGATRLNRKMTGMAVTCSAKGYYMVAGDGGVFAFGNARYHGSTAGQRLISPIFAIVSNCADSGYWLVARDGGVFAVGHVGFYGSLGGAALASPVVALLPTPTFHGYWLVAADGKTYPFGDAGH
ncbi:MAG TPA: fibronectin type III domain-containing protein [Acidimicrobiia bacterium]|nr:fibronectin type III domain-containing protein [Acidimicrobiia bacterium]